MTLHLIGADLDGHTWYEQLAARLVSEVEAFAGRRAAFEAFLSADGERAAAEADEPRV
jgi:hypothetical protein